MYAFTYMGVFVLFTHISNVYVLTHMLGGSAPSAPPRFLKCMCAHVYACIHTCLHMKMYMCASTICLNAKHVYICGVDVYMHMLSCSILRNPLQSCEDCICIYVCLLYIHVHGQRA